MRTLISKAISLSLKRFACAVPLSLLGLSVLTMYTHRSANAEGADASLRFCNRTEEPATIQASFLSGEIEISGEECSNDYSVVEDKLYSLNVNYDGDEYSCAFRIPQGYDYRIEITLEGVQRVPVAPPNTRDPQGPSSC